MEPTSSWILVGFVTSEPQWELLGLVVFELHTLPSYEYEQAFKPLGLRFLLCQMGVMALT